ncbi:dual specificity protein kinase splB-like isoform X1 [Chelonus insularis]|uniref:dual specificity protein kinase splB-like isoform X1 n=1 Tax=Chelonus insularis TaxID=460826 RepID=UPI00158D490C|nr:dual specificity protein kinase splB-like isoform X1 [Chelonus insularis]XP_034940099.1 dual specificity protein kinase splB-like isoform X1 [Chelonus insularis]
MRINIIAVNASASPHKIRKCRSYRNLANQILLGPSTSSSPIDDKIIEEEEEYNMVEDELADELNASLSQQLIRNESGINNSVNENNNNNNRPIGWQVQDDEDTSDKEDDDEVEEANLESETNDDLNVNNLSSSLSHADPPEIRVTTDDDSLIQMAQEYRGNFDGFAEINHFNTIEEMHDFIKNTLEISPTSTSETASHKQELYLDILLNEPPEDRFRRLFETSRQTVRQVLIRNEDILQELFASASLDNFPSPLASVDDNEMNEDDTTHENSKDIDVEENMKRWYMIEMIGLWLRMITDVKTYRAAIKLAVLMKMWGIENNRYEGIAVPLKYK